MLFCKLNYFLIGSSSSKDDDIELMLIYRINQKEKQNIVILIFIKII